MQTSNVFIIKCEISRYTYEIQCFQTAQIYVVLVIFNNSILFIIFLWWLFIYNRCNTRFVISFKLLGDLLIVIDFYFMLLLQSFHC